MYIYIYTHIYIYIYICVWYSIMGKYFIYIYNIHIHIYMYIYPIMGKCLNKLWYIQNIQYYIALRFANSFNGISKFLKKQYKYELHCINAYFYSIYWEKENKNETREKKTTNGYGV